MYLTTVQQIHSRHGQLPGYKKSIKHKDKHRNSSSLANSDNLSDFLFRHEKYQLTDSMARSLRLFEMSPEFLFKVKLIEV